jgi:hypothetical protein
VADPTTAPHQGIGFLIAGVSARLKLDEPYRAFYDLLASRVASMIANARAYDGLGTFALFVVGIFPYS